MVRYFARRLAQSRQYQYGISVLPEPENGLFLIIEVEGQGEIPSEPESPATSAQHHNWIAAIKEAGFNVTITPIPDE